MPLPETPRQGDPAPVPTTPTSPLPPVPAPPRPLGDSQPEPDPSSPISSSAESPRVPVLVAGVAILFLLTLALLMVRSKMRGGDHFASPNPNQVPGTIETPIRADSVGTLDPLDGSASIALNRDLLVSAEGLVIGRAVELCHIEIRGPTVSRRHARCRLIRGSLRIEDLHSAGGLTSTEFRLSRSCLSKSFQGKN